MNPVGNKFLISTSVLLVALGIAGRVNANIITVDESITFTDPPIEIISANNPFDFLFASLPTSPVSDGTVDFTGLADLGQAGEFFTVFVDGLSFGIIDPPGEFFFESISIPFLTLTSILGDGELLVRLNFSDAVDSPLPGDFITSRLRYEASVPEPATLGLMAVGLAGLGLLRRSRRRARVSPRFFSPSSRLKSTSTQDAGNGQNDVAMANGS